MADTKITALAAIATVDPAADVLPIVDISDTSMAASGTTKKVTSNQILGSGGTATLASATITGAATVGTTLGVTGVSTFAAGTVSLPALTTTGDTNTGIYYPAADTFAVTTGGTERYRVDSAGNLGIGVTPSAWGGSYKALQLQSVARSIASTGAGVGDLTVAFNAIYDSTDSRWEYAGTGDKAVRYSQTGSGNHRWFVSNTAGTAGNEITDFASAAMTLDASGNLSLANGNLVMSTSGKGIDFSATASGSGTMTSELLNDYEEGTFTPTIVGATTAGVGVYTAQYGRYTKIGNRVFCDIYLAWTAHTGTGNMEINALPFTVDSSGIVASISIGQVDNIALTAGNILSGLTVASSTSIKFRQLPVGGGASTPVSIDTAASILLSVCYTA